MRQKWCVPATATLIIGLVTAGMCWSNNLPTLLHAASKPAAATGTISGTLIQLKGGVVANATISLTTVPGRGQMPVLVGTTNTDAKGKFKFNNLAPGTYDVQAVWLSIGVDKRVAVHKNSTSAVLLILPDELIHPQSTIQKK